jgi:ABC-type multidrug transport system fused ATPase/permease subunit
MEEPLGDRLISEKLVTPEQVDKALGRQKLHGGRLGANLITLGFIDQSTLDAFLKKAPPPPTSMDDTGLEADQLAELVLKTVLFMANFTMAEVASRVRLPVSIVDRALEMLRQKKFCEVKGGTDFSRTSYTYSITDAGKEGAREAMDRCHYVGPAPVSLEDYQTMVDSQTIKTAFVDPQTIRDAFSHLVIHPRILNQLGPAVNSGKSIFLYGPPGNGKTTIAETIADLFTDGIYIPHAVEVDRQIIRVFDPIHHRKLDGEEASAQASPPRLLMMSGGSFAGVP